MRQLGFGNVLAQCSVLFLSYQKPNFLFASVWQLGRGKYNVPTPKEHL